jgi:hypothetical protein
MTGTLQTPPDDRAQAREAVAARLERLARLVRANASASEADFDAAYRAIVRLAAQIRPVTVQ